MVPEDGGVAGVGEEIGVAQGNAALREGPVLLRAACIAST